MEKHRADAADERSQLWLERGVDRKTPMAKEQSDLERLLEDMGRPKGGGKTEMVARLIAFQEMEAGQAILREYASQVSYYR